MRRRQPARPRDAWNRTAGWTVRFLLLGLILAGRPAFPAGAEEDSSGVVLRLRVDCSEFLRFRIMRNGEEVPRAASWVDWVFTHEGPRLEPGAEVCDVVDLLQYYGSPAQVVRRGSPAP